MFEYRYLEQQELEHLHYMATGTNIYMPYFPYQQKFMEKALSKAKTNPVFEPRTDNDHMSVRDAFMARYVKERQILKQLSQQARNILKDEYSTPDDEITQEQLGELTRKGVISHDEGFLIYSMFQNQRARQREHLVN